MATVYRAEVIGSLLRPTYLKQARKAFEAGQLSTPEFKRIEDRAVDEAIALQESAELDVVTDGEMRRFLFSDPLTEVIDGLSQIPGVTLRWHGRTPQEGFESVFPVAVTGKLRRRRSLATEEFAYARGKATKPLKVTLPSPLQIARCWSPKHSTAVYSDPFALFADSVDIVRQEALDLARLGCRYIQVDAPHLSWLLDESQRQALSDELGVSSGRMLNEGIEMINSVAEAPGVTFGLHVCRGNWQGRWLTQGGYEAISKPVFQRATNFSAFLLEYDDWRSGSFQPLVDIPKDKTVVLGLVSTKKNELEPAEGIVARIREASRRFPLERLALSTQCGFASVMMGNPIDEAMQEAKLRLVADVARRVWG